MRSMAMDHSVIIFKFIYQKFTWETNRLINYNFYIYITRRNGLNINCKKHNRVAEYSMRPWIDSNWHWYGIKSHLLKIYRNKQNLLTVYTIYTTWRNRLNNNSKKHNRVAEYSMRQYGRGSIRSIRIGIDKNSSTKNLQPEKQTKPFNRLYI